LYLQIKDLSEMPEFNYVHYSLGLRSAAAAGLEARPEIALHLDGTEPTNVLKAALTPLTTIMNDNRDAYAAYSGATAELSYKETQIMTEHHNLAQEAEAMVRMIKNVLIQREIEKTTQVPSVDIKESPRP
jgi:hypothetical protein